MTDKIKRVCDFYAITHRLKNELRIGWKMWAVNPDRYESVAEHIYGCQMLAFAIISEFELELDAARVAMLLALHELGECIIGDLPATGCPVSVSEKSEMEKAAVQKILGGLYNSGQLLDLFMEFEEKKTPEARFAYLIDKMECDFQCKYHEEKGFSAFADIWIANHVEKHFKSDKTFTKIAQYIIANKVFGKV